MDYTTDSDVSEDTQELVRQGLASVKRKSVTVPLHPERTRERLSVINMDTSNIRHPLCQESSNGATSTHGLNIEGRKIAKGQNHNIHRELAETESFIEAITDGNLRMRIRDKEPKDLDRVLRIA